MENIPEECQRYAEIAKRSAGWVFAYMLNYYYGETALVLKEENGDGKDLILAITDEWLRANHVSILVPNKHEAETASRHIEACPKQFCLDMKERINMISQFHHEGKLPGGAGIAIDSAVQSRRFGSKSVLSKNNGWGDAISEIKPYFLWFHDDPGFWLWPGYPEELLP